MITLIFKFHFSAHKDHMSVGFCEKTLKHVDLFKKKRKEKIFVLKEVNMMESIKM